MKRILSTLVTLLLSCDYFYFCPPILLWIAFMGPVLNNPNTFSGLVFSFLTLTVNLLWFTDTFSKAGGVWTRWNVNSLLHFAISHHPQGSFAAPSLLTLFPALCLYSHIYMVKMPSTFRSFFYTAFQNKTFGFCFVLFFTCTAKYFCTSRGFLLKLQPHLW